MIIFHCCKCGIYFEGQYNHVGCRGIIEANAFEMNRIAEIIDATPDHPRPFRLTEAEFLSFRTELTKKFEVYFDGKRKRKREVVVAPAAAAEPVAPPPPPEPEVEHPWRPAGYKMTPEQIDAIYERAGKYGPGGYSGGRTSRDHASSRTLQARTQHR